MIESHLAMDFLLLPSRTWARPRLVVCRPKETVARGGRSFRSNRKPAGFARPEVVAPRFPGAIMNRRTVILARACRRARFGRHRRLRGVAAARVAAITYGKPADDPSLLISGIGRAEAMAYRDARGQAMTDLDWSEIECHGGAYRSLKAAVGAGNP